MRARQSAGGCQCGACAESTRWRRRRHTRSFPTVGRFGRSPPHSTPGPDARRRQARGPRAVNCGGRRLLLAGPLIDHRDRLIRASRRRTAGRRYGRSRALLHSDTASTGRTQGIPPESLHTFFPRSPAIQAARQKRSTLTAHNFCMARRRGVLSNVRGRDPIGAGGALLASADRTPGSAGRHDAAAPASWTPPSC